MNLKGMNPHVPAMRVLKIPIVGGENPRQIMPSHFAKVVFYAGLVQEYITVINAEVPGKDLLQLPLRISIRHT